MKVVAEKHQKRIARDTLKMTPAGADIMGGMTFKEAYEYIFKCDVIERLEGLVNEYGMGYIFSWELESYGWDNPYELLVLIKANS